MTPLPRRLLVLTYIVRAGAAFGAAVTLVYSAYVWSDLARVRAAAPEMASVPQDLSVIDNRAWALAALGALPLLCVTVFGLWQLWRLFGEYAAGRCLAPATQGYLRRLGWSLLAASILQPLERAWIGVAFTLGLPSGQHMLTLGYGTNEFLLLLGSGLVLSVAYVMSEASRIAEENRLFV